MNNKYDITAEEEQETQEWLTTKWCKREECIATIIKLAKLRGERITEDTEEMLEKQTDEVLEKTLKTYL